MLETGKTIRKKTFQRKTIRKKTFQRKTISNKANYDLKFILNYG